MSPSVQLDVYQLRSQPLWIVPLLAWCWRYVLMKKGDDEEGEHLHSWLPEERITAAYYYIKQLGAPTAPRLWEMLSPWWHSMLMTIDSRRLRACCMFAMMSLNKPQWETLMKCSAMNYKLKGQRGEKHQHWGRGGEESFIINNKSIIYGFFYQTNVMKTLSE